MSRTEKMGSLWWGLGVAGLLAAVAAWAWLRLEQYAIRAITRPARSTFRTTPDDFGLAWEDVTFRTADGVDIRAWFLPAAPDPTRAKGTIIQGHGYVASRHADLRYPAFLVPGGYNVLMLDFRAHGESGGEQTSVGYVEHHDVRAALDYLRARGLERVGVMGFSMGAVVAIVSGALCPAIAGVVAESSYARFARPLAQILHDWGYPWPVANLGGELGIRFVARNLGFDAAEAAPVRLIGRISPRPVFIIHGEADPLIPVSEAHALYAAANEPKQLWIAPGAVHDGGAFALYPDEYRHRVLAFWDRVFAAPASDQ
jgi:fermentation-respiration switch protein FrsA (DUF1100 family)